MCRSLQDWGQGAQGLTDGNSREDGFGREGSSETWERKITELAGGTSGRWEVSEVLSSSLVYVGAEEGAVHLVRV